MYLPEAACRWQQLQPLVPKSHQESLAATWPALVSGSKAAIKEKLLSCLEVAGTCGVVQQLQPLALEANLESLAATSQTIIVIS